MFHRKANLPEEELRDLYVNQGLTMTEIAERYNVGASSVRRRLGELGVVSRARGPKGSSLLPHREFGESDLREWYLEQKLSIPQIAELAGWGRETVRQRMLEYGIPIRSFTQAHIIQHGTQDQYKDFSGDVYEKAYLIGFRMGDLYVKREHKGSEGIRVLATSSRPEQIELIERLFGHYGHLGQTVQWRLSLRGPLKCVNLSISLNHTFDFLLEYPTEIPDWILKDPKTFLAFFGGFSDAEGSFHLQNHRGTVARGRYSLKNTDRRVLEQCHEQLIVLGIHCSSIGKVYDAGKQTSKRGVFATKALWEFSVEQKESLLRFIELITPFILHAKRHADMERVRENVEWRNSDEFHQQAKRKRADSARYNTEVRKPKQN
jgi:hypothetical protein